MAFGNRIGGVLPARRALRGLRQRDQHLLRCHLAGGGSPAAQGSQHLPHLIRFRHPKLLEELQSLLVTLLCRCQIAPHLSDLPQLYYVQGEVRGRR